jgi:phosphoribosylamine--glycine ligase
MVSHSLELLNGKRRNVLVIGGGGREHALGWKLAQSRLVQDIFYAPGNAGTETNMPFQSSDFDKLVSFAKNKDCFTVVGPEGPISQGIVDIFLDNALEIFGPSLNAARIETSKSYAKELLRSQGIPTPEFALFVDQAKAKDYVYEHPENLVIKADGLAAGKGVVICKNQQEAIDAIERMMVKRRFGEAGEKIVIEKRIEGIEASFIVLSDGQSTKAFAACRDYKNIGDGDMGPNTGGMGSFSPVPYIDQDLEKEVLDKIINRTISKMKDVSDPFVGFLYAGLIIDDKGKGYVLEFNARMGDPECQPLMVRLDSDLFEYLYYTANGRLGELPPLQWKDLASVCVVMCSRGYPSKYSTGKTIRGLRKTYPQDINIFHSGTATDSTGNIITNGGRVLSVTALAPSLRQARERAYEVVHEITWGANEQYFRKDIGSYSVRF